MNVAQLKALCKEYGLKVAGKKALLKERLSEHRLSDPIGERPPPHANLVWRDLTASGGVHYHRSVGGCFDLT